MTRKYPEECWQIAARSETGYVREANEDRMGAFALGDDRLYVVSDGMGGHSAGARAAELTVQALPAALTTALAASPVEEALCVAVKQVNALVYGQAHSGDPATEHMGATLVALLTRGRNAYLAHVGDSRAYLFRDGRLTRLTRDHSHVQGLVDAGELSENEVRGHPLGSVLVRAIGNEPDVEVSAHPPLRLNRGDGILLCSDGLSGYVEDRDMEAVLAGSGGIQAAADRLVGLALDAGGHDNVTVQYVRYGGRGDSNPGRGMARRLGELMKGSGVAWTITLLAGAGLAASGFAIHRLQSKPAPEVSAPGKAQPQLSQPGTLEKLQARIDNLERELKGTRQRVEDMENSLKSLEAAPRAGARRAAPKSLRRPDRSP